MSYGLLGRELGIASNQQIRSIHLLRRILQIECSSLREFAREHVASISTLSIDSIQNR